MFHGRDHVGSKVGVSEGIGVIFGRLHGKTSIYSGISWRQNAYGSSKRAQRSAPLPDRHTPECSGSPFEINVVEGRDPSGGPKLLTNNTLCAKEPIDGGLNR